MPFAEKPFEPYGLDVVHCDDGPLSLWLRAATVDDALVWARDWQPVLARQSPPSPDAVWPWMDHIVRAVTEAERACIAVERAGKPSAIEALLSLSVEPSKLSPGLPLVYLEYVGTAPANQPPPVGKSAIEPRLGPILVIEALLASLDNGYGGRVGLHSKADHLTRWYARKFGFEPLGEEITIDGTLLYMECTGESAMKAVGGRHDG